MFNENSRFFSLALVLIMGIAPAANATDRSIILQSTTSTANSGLYKFLLPKFEKMTGIKVRVVAVGTGQALRNGRAGDGHAAGLQIDAASSLQSNRQSAAGGAQG